MAGEGGRVYFLYKFKGAAHHTTFCVVVTVDYGSLGQQVTWGDFEEREFEGYHFDPFPAWITGDTGDPHVLFRQAIFGDVEDLDWGDYHF
jgi:hypothetical protein